MAVTELKLYLAASIEYRLTLLVFGTAISVSPSEMNARVHLRRKFSMDCRAHRKPASCTIELATSKHVSVTFRTVPRGSHALQPARDG